MNLNDHYAFNIRVEWLNIISNESIDPINDVHKHTRDYEIYDKFESIYAKINTILRI